MRQLQRRVRGWSKRAVVNDHAAGSPMESCKGASRGSLRHSRLHSMGRISCQASVATVDIKAFESVVFELKDRAK